MKKNPCTNCLVKPCCNEPCKELNRFLLLVEKQTTYMSFIPFIFFITMTFFVSLLSNFYKINIFIYFVLLVISLGLLIATGLYVQSIQKFIKKQLMKR